MWFYHSFEDILLFSNHQPVPCGQPLIKINSILKLTLKIQLQWSNTTDTQFSFIFSFHCFHLGSWALWQETNPGKHTVQFIWYTKAVVCSVKQCPVYKPAADCELYVSSAGWRDGCRRVGGHRDLVDLAMCSKINPFVKTQQATTRSYISVLCCCGCHVR